MAISDEKVRQLAAQVSAYVSAQHAVQKCSRRIIVPEHARAPGSLDDARREATLRRIHFLAGRFDLYWLIEQRTNGGPAADLTDDDLLALGRECEKALQCIEDGVSFYDAGLVKRRFDE